jgi:hypothetical protein
MTGHPDCFGTMLPSIQEGQSNVTHKGKVFSFRIEKAGGTFVESRKTETDIKQWEECARCPDFDSCYRLSSAKLALETAVRTIY